MPAVLDLWVAPGPGGHAVTRPENTKKRLILLMNATQHNIKNQAKVIYLRAGMTGQCNLNTMAKLKSTRHRCDTQPRRAITEASYYMQGQMRQASTGASRSPAYLYNAPARFLLYTPRCRLNRLL